MINEVISQSVLKPMLISQSGFGLFEGFNINEEQTKQPTPLHYWGLRRDTTWTRRDGIAWCTSSSEYVPTKRFYPVCPPIPYAFDTSLWWTSLRLDVSFWTLGPTWDWVSDSDGVPCVCVRECVYIYAWVCDTHTWELSSLHLLCRPMRASLRTCCLSRQLPTCG